MADFFSSLLQGAPQIGEGISQGILGGTQALVSLQQADATRQIAQEQADTQRQQVENNNPIRLHAIDVASALAQSLPQYDAYLRSSPQFGDGRGGLNPQGQHLLDMRHRQLSAYGQMAQTGDAGALLNILDQIDPATGVPKDPLAPTPPAPGADTSPSLGTPSSFTPAQLPQVGAALGAAGQFLPFGAGLSLAGQSLTAPPPPAAPASPAIPAPGSPDYAGYAARGAQSTPGQAAAAVPIPPITPTPTPDLGTRLFQQGNLPGALTQPPQMAPGTPPNPWASVPGPPAPTPAPPTAPLPRAGEPGFVGPVQPPATLAAPLPPTPSPGLPANGAAPHAPPGFGAVPAADASGPTYNMPGGVQITPGANGVPQVAAPGFAPVAVPTYNEIMSRVGALPTVQGAVQRRDQWQRMVDSYTQTGTPVPPDLLTAYDDANKEYDAAVKDGIGVVAAALKLPSEVNTAVAGAYASLATGANQQETATVAGAKLPGDLAQQQVQLDATKAQAALDRAKTWESKVTAGLMTSDQAIRQEQADAAKDEAYYHGQQVGIDNGKLHLEQNKFTYAPERELVSKTIDQRWEHNSVSSSDRVGLALLKAGFHEGDSYQVLNVPMELSLIGRGMTGINLSQELLSATAAGEGKPGGVTKLPVVPKMSPDGKTPNAALGVTPSDVMGMAITIKQGRSQQLLAGAAKQYGMNDRHYQRLQSAFSAAQDYLRGIGAGEAPPTPGTPGTYTPANPTGPNNNGVGGGVPGVTGF